MPPIITLLIIATVALIGYVLPKKYNEYFYGEYRENAVSMPMATVTAISFSLWLLFMDFEGFWYWFLLIASIIVCIISILYTIYIGISVRASSFEIVIAVIAQILATAGVIILILGIILLIMEAFNKKKKKR